MANETNEKVETEVVEEIVVDKNENGVLKDIAKGFKQNWWKFLIGGATAVAAFAAGVLIGNNDRQNEPDDVAEDDAPFDIDTASEI